MKKIKFEEHKLIFDLEKQKDLLGKYNPKNIIFPLNNGNIDAPRIVFSYTENSDYKDVFIDKWEPKDVLQILLGVTGSGKTHR